MAMHISEVICDFLGSCRSQEINPGRTGKSREKRGHHDVPAGSEECPAPRRYPTPPQVCRDRRRAHQPPGYHQSPEIRCPFHNGWGKVSKNIGKSQKRKRTRLNMSQMQMPLKSSCFSPKLPIFLFCLEIPLKLDLRLCWYSLTFWIEKCPISGSINIKEYSFTLKNKVLPWPHISWWECHLLAPKVWVQFPFWAHT